MQFRYLVTHAGLDYLYADTGVELDELIQERLILGMRLDQLHVTLVKKDVDIQSN